MKKVVIFGGDTGTFVVLSGLKKYRLDISVIVSMMDSGGSTGRLRDQLGVLPPGDFRQCLVALSEASELWRTLFLYRFETGDLKGHNFGNIFITALEKITKNYQEVVSTASFILKTKGKVIPVTFDKVHLCVQYDDGGVIETEDRIEHEARAGKIKKAYLVPQARANEKAVKAISDADYLIFGPGDLYTSLIPNLLVGGISEAITRSHAKIIMIANLMTKKGQTTHYTMSEHVRDLEKYLGKKIDIIVANSKKIEQAHLDYYAKFGEAEVVDDLHTAQKKYVIIKRELLSEVVHKKSSVDTAVRSLLRHDSEKVGTVLFEVVQ